MMIRWGACPQDARGPVRMIKKFQTKSQKPSLTTGIEEGMTIRAWSKSLTHQRPSRSYRPALSGATWVTQGCIWCILSDPLHFSCELLSKHTCVSGDSREADLAAQQQVQVAGDESHAGSQATGGWEAEDGPVFSSRSCRNFLLHRKAGPVPHLRLQEYSQAGQQRRARPINSSWL